MALLAIILCLFLERVWTTLAELRTFAWFERLIDRIRGKDRQHLWSGVLGVVTAFALPLVALLIAQYVLIKILALFGFVLAVAVLLYSLGPRDLDGDVHRFLNAWEQGDDVKAQDYAQRIYPVTARPFDAGSLGRGVVEGTLIAAHERWFGVIFWFVILGPLGALWYRLACVLREKCLRQSEEEGAFKDAALMMHHILAWIPVRLTLFSYALVGNFAEALEAWRKEGYGWKNNWLMDNYQLLIRGGLGALQLEQDLATDEISAVDARHVRAALGLALRALILAIALIAVITVGTWAS